MKWDLRFFFFFWQNLETLCVFLHRSQRKRKKKDILCADVRWEQPRWRNRTRGRNGGDKQKNSAEIRRTGERLCTTEGESLCRCSHIWMNRRPHPWQMFLPLPSSWLPACKKAFVELLLYTWPYARCLWKEQMCLWFHEVYRLMRNTDHRLISKLISVYNLKWGYEGGE